MKILIDEKNVVRGWQTVGGGFSDTEYTTVEVDEIPEEVQENSEKYCYVNEMYVDNPDYVEPTPTETVTDTEILNTLLGVNE